MYVPEDLEEPPFQYVPEVLPTSATIKGVVPPLQESLMLLGEGLEASSLVAQFEQLYRRKPGLTVTEARRPDNEKKNRYRDISPCKCSPPYFFVYVYVFLQMFEQVFIVWSCA